jgi:hypothetical protein
VLGTNRDRGKAGPMIYHWHDELKDVEHNDRRSKDVMVDANSERSHGDGEACSGVYC